MLQIYLNRFFSRSDLPDQTFTYLNVTATLRVLLSWTKFFVTNTGEQRKAILGNLKSERSPNIDFERLPAFPGHLE